MERIFQTVTFNIAGGVTEETIDGKVYLVADTVMLTEGVHKGSNGKLLYRADQLSKNTSSWDNKPIVLNHPTDKDGKPALARDLPEYVEKYGLGFLKNTTWNGKLRTKSYFDKEKTKKVEPRVLLALESNKTIEVSTGLAMEIDKTSGTFNGESYDSDTKGYDPDHLAVLLEHKGACDVKKGCGANVTNCGDKTDCQCETCVANAGKSTDQNNPSFRKIITGIQDAVYKQFGYNVYVRDVYDGYFIYGKEYDKSSPLYKKTYSLNKEGEVTIGTEVPEQVKFHQEYRTVKDGTFVGNCSPKETEMDKKAVINKLISSGTWKEEDRPWLETQPEDKLTRLEATLPAPEKKKPAVVANDNKPAVPTDEAAWLASAPPRIRSIVANSLQREEKEKKDLIATINSGMESREMRFTDEWLNAQDADVLKVLADMAAPALITSGGTNWRGAATVANTRTHTEEALVPTQIKFN